MTTFHSRIRRRPAKACASRWGSRASRVTLSDAWRSWVVENILRGLSREPLIDTLEANGVARDLGGAEVDSILRSPLLEGARRVDRRARRYELLCRLERETARTGVGPDREGQVERRSDLSQEEFFDHYYAGGLPVVLTNALKCWPLLARWSLAYLKERVGVSR
jgi:hypothetical protein